MFTFWLDIPSVIKNISMKKNWSSFLVYQLIVTSGFLYVFHVFWRGIWICSFAAEFRCKASCLGSTKMILLAIVNVTTQPPDKRRSGWIYVVGTCGCECTHIMLIMFILHIKFITKLALVGNSFFGTLAGNSCTRQFFRVRVQCTHFHIILHICVLCFVYMMHSLSHYFTY